MSTPICSETFLETLKENQNHLQLKVAAVITDIYLDNFTGDKPLIETSEAKAT